MKLDINVPLMREFTVDREKDKVVEADVATENENEKKKNNLLWCHFEYEHMSDLCYTCSIIGHSDKECRMKPAM